MRSSSLSPIYTIPEAARLLLVRKIAQAFGLLLIGSVIATLVALLTWSAQDPSWNFAHDGPVRNALGAPGALISDLVMQLWGIASLGFLAPIAVWGALLLQRHKIDNPLSRCLLLACGSTCIAGLASLLPTTASWPLPTGLGGVLGDTINLIPHKLSQAIPAAHAVAAQRQFRD